METSLCYLYNKSIMDKIVIKGASQHNLKHIDLELPRNKLIAVSGVSGSGKSSLAFDTVFAEGQRRYVESLSAYARQFLGRLDKPEVDDIEGLSPAVSIEQKTTHKNPRSTVGTVTEIYDYYRLLFARIGTPHCPECGREIREQSVDQIVDTVLSYPEGTRLIVAAPVVMGRKGEFRKIFTDAADSGFVRVRVDGEIRLLSEEIDLDKKQKHDIDIIVDRIVLSSEARHRTAESVETALSLTDGIVKIDFGNGEESRFFSQKSACVHCGISLPELQPRLFSFNNPYGACPECAGLGMTMDFAPELVVPDETLSLENGAVVPGKDSQWLKAWLSVLSSEYGFSTETPFGELPPEIRKKLLYGDSRPLKVSFVSRHRRSRVEYNEPFPGIIPDLRRRYYEPGQYANVKSWYEQFMRSEVCSRCGGRRLRPEALAVTVGGMNIHGLCRLSVEKSAAFFDRLRLSETEEKISAQILKEIRERLLFLNNVGLGYLTLERSAGTLSGGEAQRIRLATQIGSHLTGVLYVLDEPSIGLHQRDNQKLIDSLKALRDIGNTLIVVEHDEQTLLEADYLVDLGPGAGVNGGRVVAQGTPSEVMRVPESLTGCYLNGTLRIESHRPRRKGSGRFLTVVGASENNLKNIDVSVPLGTFTVITGVSGSGKSSLLESVLYPALSNRLNKTRLRAGAFTRIDGMEFVDKVINIDQSPIGRTPRSNPATYVGFFTEIRDLFASLPESKARGYKPGRFSFNVSGGRCENCNGDGVNTIEMHFLPDVHITCDVCKGKRYNRETLEIRYKGKNISDILDMTVAEALEFFEKHPSIRRKIATLSDVGLDYICLGQSALTFSGGEAQRIKLASELIKKSTGSTVYIIDEPTTGLHFADVKKLLEILQLLADRGNTVILIEHNLDVIKQADRIIDLGPEGGDGGGRLVACGTPEEVAGVKESYTGFYLKQIFDKERSAEI